MAEESSKLIKSQIRQTASSMYSQANVQAQFVLNLALTLVQKYAPYLNMCYYFCMGIKETFLLAMATITWVCLLVTLKGAYDLSTSDSQNQSFFQFLFQNLSNPPREC
ncbi:MAG: hypothetical protein HRT47_00685 [Candidatus Caenarcaniphilales bacterium]|nr:hypothetical protein [Candidatus Caenarcaniphilales bacterium]